MTFYWGAGFTAFHDDYHVVIEIDANPSNSGLQQEIAQHPLSVAIDSYSFGK